MASPYDKLLEMISCLDLQDDGIRMNHKIKSIEQDFCNIIKDEQMLSESMDYMNNKVLGDNELALKFALLFSSRNFDSLAMNDFKVRCKMLNILQTNYSNADKYRKDDKNRLYNSITLLGEYYHRVRLADGNPISILGESLIGLLTQELNTENLNLNNDLNNIDGIIDIDLKLAKLILSQVTLNGDIMRTTHKNELNNLLYHIRKILIEQHNLIPAVKALLLMTLDLYYSNFTSLTKQLEEMYTKYLVEEDKLNRTNIDEEKINHDHNNPQQPEHPEQLNDIIENNIENDDNNKKLLIIEQQQQNDDTLFNNIENNNSNNNDSYELPPISNKKWSEQVCEDSMFESELSLLQDNINFCGDNINDDELLCYQSLPPQSSGSMLNDTSSSNLQQPLIKKSPSQVQQDNSNYNKHRLSSSSPRNEHSNTTTNNHYRSNHINNNNNQHQYNSNQNQSHHWGQQQQQRTNNRHHNNNNYDDDRTSVRSEGGSIRLYSVGDRLRHAQSTATTSTPSSLHNSRNNQQQSGGRDNWDRGSGYHTYDSRRRSNSRNSNYESNTNNNNNGGYRNNNNQQQQQNNRNNYDRPPRFSKNIESSWRNNTTPDPTTRSVSRGPDSRSSSRNRTTLPRPNRHSGNFENYNNTNSVVPGIQPPPSVSPDGSVVNNVGGNNQHRNNNNRHYHKDNGGYNNRNTSGSGHFSHHNSNQQQQQNRQQSRNFGRSNNNNNQQQQQQPHYSNNRYGSHNSLTSDTGTWERRGRPNNLRRNTRGKSQDWEDTRSVHGEPNNKWDEPSITPTTIPTTRPDDDEQRICTNDDEITKNARNTTKYMQYLSQK